MSYEEILKSCSKLTTIQALLDLVLNYLPGRNTPYRSRSLFYLILRKKDFMLDLGSISQHLTQILNSVTIVTANG